MKTTLHLSHPHPAAVAGRPRPERRAVDRRTTLRLGVVLSVLAAVVAVAVEAVVDVPVALLVVPVVVVGSALSWHASGRRRTPRRRGSATMSP